MRPVREIVKRKLFKDTVVLQANTFASTAINLVTSIALTRMLHTDGYGTYVLIFALFNLLNIGRFMSPGIAIVNKIAEANAGNKPDDIRDAIGYYMKMSLLIGVVIGLVGAIWGPKLAELIYEKPLVKIAVRLIFLTAILGIFTNLALVLLQGLRMMRHYAVLNIGQLCIRLVLISFFLILRCGITGVVAAHLLTAVISSIISIVLLARLRRSGSANIPKITEVLSRMFRVPFRKYFGFACIISINKQATTLIGLVPVLLLGRFVEGNEAAGYFNLGLHIVTALWAGFHGFAHNLLPYLSEIKGRNDIRALKDRFLKITLYSGLASMVFAGAFAVIARYAVLFIYGEAYLPVVPIIYVLLAQYVFCSFGIAVNSFYIVSQRILFALFSKVLLLAVSIPLAVLFVRKFEEIGAAIYYSGLLSAIMAVYLVDIISRIRKTHVRQ